VSQEQPVKYMSFGEDDSDEAFNVRFLENSMVKFDNTDGKDLWGCPKSHLMKFTFQ